MLILLIALAAVGGLGAYYFKVYLLKKKLENADDIDDFEFIEGEDEETESEDDTYSEDETEDDV